MKTKKESSRGNRDGNHKLHMSRRERWKMAVTLGTATVYAKESGGGDPLTVVNNLSTFIFGLIRAIGMILLGLGIVQVGLSLKSHDPSQRANGFLTLAGGIIITFAKEILALITG